MSEIITYVLILSLAVSLGTFIAVWYKGTTERQASGILTPLEGSSECDEVNVNIAFNYGSCTITVYNTGGLAISGMRINYADATGGFNSTEYNSVSLMPRANMPIEIPVEGLNRVGLSNINIIPIILSGKQPYYCSKGYNFNTNGEFSGC